MEETFIKESSELAHVKTETETITATTNHPFYVPQKGFVEAIHLKAGDRLQTINGEYVIVEQVQHEILEAPVKVYNFRVANNHTYYVGENAVGVHNNGGCAGNGGTGSRLAQYGDDFGKMGTYVENPNIKVDWSQYAAHGSKRMKQRGMTQKVIENIIENGKALSQNGGNKFAYISKEGVVVSKEGKLVTGWTSANFDKSMISIVNKLFGE